MEFVTESGVVSVVVTCQRVVWPCGVCYRGWSDVRCRDLPESSGRMAEARLGHLVEWNSSLSQYSERSSDVFEVADGLLLGALGVDTADRSHLL